MKRTNKHDFDLLIYAEDIEFIKATCNNLFLFQKHAEKLNENHWKDGRHEVEIQI